MVYVLARKREGLPRERRWREAWVSPVTAQSAARRWGGSRRRRASRAGVWEQYKVRPLWVLESWYQQDPALRLEITPRTTHLVSYWDVFTGWLRRRTSYTACGEE